MYTLVLGSPAPTATGLSPMVTVRAGPVLSTGAAMSSSSGPPLMTTPALPGIDNVPASF